MHLCRVMFNAGVESLRAFGILAVVELHCLRPYFERGPPWEDRLRIVLDFATPGFFFISGFLVSRFKLKRIKRIYSPVLLVSGLKIAQQLLRRSFFQGLVKELALTHLGPKKFRENCLLHVELAGFEPSIIWDPWEPLLGTAFGHFYFIPVLAQLHLLPLSRLSESNLRRLTIALFVWHLCRHLIDIPWRLPFLWIFHYVHGYYIRHARHDRVVGLCYFVVALISLVLALLGYSFFKDIYVLAVPPAACILITSSSKPRQLLARYSYTIFLYHGFFLSLGNFFLVFPATFLFCFILDLALKPHIALHAFGITPDDSTLLPCLVDETTPSSNTDPPPPEASSLR